MTASARRPPLAAIALVGVVGALAGCAEGAAEPRNVLLVVLDTVGAEHVGSGGARTPAIDRLAAEGTRFARAYSTAPWTKPAVASLFTSRMPSALGVRKAGDSLGEEAATLAELLGARGFRTHGIVAHFLLLPKFGFARGFESYDPEAIAGHDGSSSAEITDRAIAWLDEAGTERFFLFVHYFDPHFLYLHHPEFRHTPDYDGMLRPAMPIWTLRDLRPRLSADDVAYLVGLYREEIAFTDHHLGRLLDHLDETGLDDETLVVLTSDHGEEFMRHGWIGHTRTLYDELLRVPLVVRRPGRPAPGVVDVPVSLLDVVPTIAELLGLPADASWEGRSLVPLLDDPRLRTEERFLHAEVAFGTATDSERRSSEKSAHKTALISSDRKLIHDLTTDRWELYATDEDPEELENLLDSDPNAAGQLRAVLAAWERARPGPDPRKPADLDEDELEELRKLGYVR